MKRAIISAVVALTVTGCAITKPPGREVEGRPDNPLAYVGDVAQTADAGTAIGATLSSGFVEMNPMGLMLAPVKMRMAAMAENNTPEDCEEAQKIIAVGGLGPAAWGATVAAFGPVGWAGLALVGVPALAWPLIEKGAEARCEDARPLTEAERKALDAKMDADRGVWGL